MSIILRKEIARILIIAFVFFLIPSDSFSVKKDERAGIKLINEAENLFRNYKYDESIEKFNKAKKIIKQEINLSRLYLGLSRSYYAIGLMVKVKEEIRLLALLTIKEPFNEDEYPRGFIKVYKGILAETAKKKKEEIVVKTEEEPVSLYKVEKTGEETKKLAGKVETIKAKPLAGVIEKPGKKKKKKKSLLLPITLGAVALGAVVMLMGKKSDGVTTSANTGSVHIDSTPSGAQVFVDGVNKGVTTPCDFTVSEGTHQLRLVIEGWGEAESTGTIAKDQNISFNVQLASYIYQVVASFDLDSRVQRNKWDCDINGNVYSAYKNSSIYVLKHDRVGDFISEAKLGYIFDLDNSWMFIARETSRMYFLVYQASRISKVYVFDLNGNSIDQFTNIVNGYDLAVDTGTGYHYCNVDQRILRSYDKFMNATGEFSLNSPFGYRTIKMSQDNEHVLIGNYSDSSLYKYSKSGEFIRSYSGYNSVFKGNFFCSYDNGDREKIFLLVDLYNIEVLGSEGQLLTSISADLLHYNSRISRDGSGNLYVSNGYKSIHLIEPSSETEGTGFWETSSVASTASRIGSLGTTRIDPFRSKRSGKPEIDKDRGKRGKKDL